MAPQETKSIINNYQINISEPNVVPKESTHLESPNSKRLLCPYTHLVEQCGGKKVRTKLVMALNHWLKVDEEIMTDIYSTIELMHNASLLIDDIQDFSEIRRGKPAAHMIFGRGNSLNCSFYVCMISARRLIDKNNYKGSELKAMFDYILPLCIGQGLDIYWRQMQICPTVDEYLSMIDMKTTGLFLLALKAMQMRSENKIDLKPLVCKIGSYFQIRDDYANLKFSEYALTKGFAEDLTEGKYSYLIVHAIRTHPEDKTIENILKLQTRDVNIKRMAVKHMEKLGTFAHTEALLKDLREKINQELVKLNENESMMKLLDMLFIDEKKNDSGAKN